MERMRFSFDRTPLRMRDASNAAALIGDRLIIIEDQCTHGVTWRLSFDGPNPTSDQCIECSGHGEALKLKALVEQYSKLRDESATSSAVSHGRLGAMSDIKTNHAADELKEHDGFLPVDARAARLQAAMLLSEAMADLAAVLRADAESDDSVASLAPISPPPPPPPPPPGVVASAER